MPRISEKAQLTTQLEDLWLIEAVENILLLKDNLEPAVLFGISSASYPALVDERSRVGLGGGLESGARADLCEIWPEGWLGSEGSEGVVRGRMYGILADCERKLDEDMREGIEILGSVISGVQYLTPREPIPRSEYLLNYHVC